jgi:hypothetical protein
MNFSRNFTVYDNLSDANSTQQNSKQEETWISDCLHNTVVISMVVCIQRCTRVSGCGLLLCSEISSPSLSGVYLYMMHDMHAYVPIGFCRRLALPCLHEYGSVVMCVQLSINLETVRFTCRT